MTELYDAAGLEEVALLNSDAFSCVLRTKKSMLPVKRGCPWKATAWPPTSKYSTSCEFNNPMNSRKSVCSFAKTTPVTLNQFEQDVEPLLGASSA